MARPIIVPINSGNQGWDARMDDNFDILGTGPLPIHESASLSESNIQSTFPAASYDRCLVWVNHSVFGYTLYRSDGTDWHPFDPQRRVDRTVTGATTLVSGEEAQIIKAGGTLPYTITLAAAGSFRGRTTTFKTLVSGTLTIGAAAIDGAGTQTITTQYGVLRIYSDGTTYHIV